MKKQYLTWKWSWSSLSLRICHQRLRKRGLHALNKGQIQILCGIRRRRDFGACQGRSRGCSLNDTRIITYYKRKGLFKIGGKNRSDIILAIFFFYSSILFKSKVFLLYEISSEKCFKICHFFWNTKTHVCFFSFSQRPVYYKSEYNKPVYSNIWICPIFLRHFFLPAGVFVSKSSSEASSSSSTMVHLRLNEAAASDGEKRLSTIGKK